MIPILVPLLNANEPEARLVAIHARVGQSIQKGDLLFTVETTKAASDVEAPADGFFRPLAEEGATLSVGDVLAYLSETADESLPPAPNRLPAEASTAEGTPSGQVSLRITNPARALAKSLGLDLARLPTDRLVTEALIRQLTGAQAGPAAPQPKRTALPQPEVGAQILLYGAGGHAKTVLEMMRALGVFPVFGIVDDNPALWGSSVLGVPVLGGREKLAELSRQGVMLAANGVGGIINIEVRVKLFEQLAAAGFAFPALIHPRATVEVSAQIGEGTQVFAHAYVGSSARLAERCMVNTGAVVSHDCEIGRYTHIAPGCLLAGQVRVGERALVGMGVTTAIGISIGDGARVGNGAVLLADVPARAIVPAGTVYSSPRK